jgi:hypothetical protein
LSRSGRSSSSRTCAVDPGADETGAAQFLEHVQVLALAIAHHRRQQHQLAALGHRQHAVDHLADGLGLQVRWL